MVWPEWTGGDAACELPSRTGRLPNRLPTKLSLICEGETEGLSCHALVNSPTVQIPFDRHAPYSPLLPHRRPTPSLMPSPYRAESPTPTSAAPSIVHASTSTIVQDGEELASKLEAERDDESRSETVNGDPRDPDPPRLDAQQPARLPFLPRPNPDPNVVTWDGPDDPENPQNWSFWYKWWLTTVCTVMTLNVYVSLIQKRLMSIPENLTHYSPGRSRLLRLHRPCPSSRATFMRREKWVTSYSPSS
jgi:hypothetical protein